MKITLDQSDLQPIIEAAVAETLRQIDERETELGSRLAFSEPDSAALLGVARHTLRDCRRRGEIHAKKVGKEFRYSRSSLLRFLAEDGSP